MGQEPRFLATTFADLVIAPNRALCPECHRASSHAWTTKRFAYDIAKEGISVLRITVGVYKCKSCVRYFRNQPAFLRKSATYSNNVMKLALASVLEDGMPISRVPRRLLRDFGVKPTENLIRYWIRKLSHQDVSQWQGYEEHVVDSFSGTLCIDEMYQGKVAILLATDQSGPHGDRLVAFQLIEGKVAADHVSTFIERIRAIGIHPSEVITDGSNLYPDVVRKIWPSASHQLYLFHKTQAMVMAVGKAVSHLRGELPKIPNGTAGGITRAMRVNGMDTVCRLRAAGKGIREIARETGHSKNTVKKWLRDSEFVSRHSGFKRSVESKKEIAQKLAQSQPHPAWDTWEQVREMKEKLTSARYLFARRDENLSSEQKSIMDAIYCSPIGESAKEISRYAQHWFSIWYDSEMNRHSPDEAYSNWEAIIRSSVASRRPSLERFSNTLNDEMFSRLSIFLHDKTWESTSNGAERYCRRIRHLQSIHYNFRSLASLRTVIEQDAIGFCQGT